MKVLVPVTFTEFTSFTATDVPTSFYPLWNSATTYNAGDRVYKDFDEYLAIAESVDVDPAVVAESPVWIRISAINVLKPFDEILFDQALNAAGTPALKYNITAPTQVSTIAFFGVEARSINVTLDRMEMIPRLLGDGSNWDISGQGVATLANGIMTVPDAFSGFMYITTKEGVPYVPGKTYRINLHVRQYNGTSPVAAIDGNMAYVDANGNVISSNSGLSVSLAPPAEQGTAWGWTSGLYAIPAAPPGTVTVRLGVRVRGPQITSEIQFDEFFIEDMENPAVPVPGHYLMTISNETKTLIDDTGIASWLDYFYEEPVALNDAIFDNLVAYPGTNIAIRVEGGATQARVGEIVLGRAYSMGELCEGTTVGIQDYSRKERDEWGNPIIVERPYSQRAEYDIAVPTTDVRKVRQVLSSVRARPAVYYDEEQTDDLGTTVYGYFQDFNVSLTVGGVSRMNLEVEGLV